jgi:hypothetical protein
MTAVTLAITQPANGTVFFQGEPEVRLAGQVVPPLPPELAGVPLHYRWYSSLFPSAEDRYSINAAAFSNPATPFDAPLGLGSHVISLAASDQAGETESDQNATNHGGVVGGAQGAGQCIIHLLRAVMVKPVVAGPPLSKASSTLEAEAPLQWGRKIGTTDNFEPNPDYHSVNRLFYRWIFEPTPANGRASAVLEPAVSALKFAPNPPPPPDPPPPPPPLVRYVGPLPTALGLGSYRLTLRVQDTQNAAIGHQVSRSVTIAA